MYSLSKSASSMTIHPTDTHRNGFAGSQYSTTKRCRTSISLSWGPPPHSLPSQGTIQRFPSVSTGTSGYLIAGKAHNVKSRRAQSRWEGFRRFLLPIPTVCRCCLPSSSRSTLTINSRRSHIRASATAR